MERFWAVVSKAMLELNDVAAFREAGRFAYRAVAHAAARVLVSLPDVDSVCLTGSLTRPEVLVPGKSDIDLLVLAKIPTLESELRLRRQLRRAHRMLHAAVPVFTNLDYLSVDDLDYFRALPGAWALDLDRHWRRLAGPNRLRRSASSTLFARARIVRVMRCMKRWGKLLPALVGAPDRDLAARTQAQRLLVEVLATWQHRDRLTPLETLLEDGGPTPTPPALRTVQSRARPSIELLLAAALEVLDRLAAEVSRDWVGEWPPAGVAPSVRLDSPLRSVVDDLHLAGFPSVVAAPPGRCGFDWTVYAVGPETTPPQTLVRQAWSARSRIWEAAPAALGPRGQVVVWTPALWRAAALAQVVPFAGSALASGPVWRSGAALPIVRCPAADTLAWLIRVRVVYFFLRRLVRTLRPPAAWEQVMAAEHHRLRPAIARAQDSGELELLAPPPVAAPVDEVELVGGLREWIAERKSVLDRSLRH